MRKKREVKRKKRPKTIPTIDEATLARFEAVKSKRDETIAMVKRRLNEKFRARVALTGENVLKDEEHGEKVSGSEMESSRTKIMKQIRKEMKKIMLAGVERVNAGKILHDKVKYDAKSSTMMILGKKYKIKKNVHVVGWGREALMLVTSLEKIIGNNLKKGFVVVPRRTIGSMAIYPELFPKLDTRVNLIEARSDDVPDDVCAKATKSIADYCKKLKKKDILIVVLSRGSDDLLCLPKGTTGLGEKMMVLKQLNEAGAAKREIGIVRKTLSAIRGGGLASLAYPAKVISLVMSDMGEDVVNLEEISGGPTIKTDHRVSLSMARVILDKYDLREHRLSHGIREILKDHNDSLTIDGDKAFESFVDNYVVASARDALDEMAVAAFRDGYVAIKMAAKSAILSNHVKLSLRRVSRDYTRLVSLMILAVENKITPMEMYLDIRENILIFDFTEKELLDVFPSKENWGLGLYLLISPPQNICHHRIFHEEKDINKTGNNQELAIYFSLDWFLRVEKYPILRKYVVWFLGAASDGRDGNTSFSGAYSYGNLAVDVYRQFVNQDILKNSKNNEFNEDLTREEMRAIHESILPDRVLTSGNANRLFVNVNNGEELLKLGDSSGCTQTRVGDLHIVRIVRHQCSCDGLCTQ